MVLVQIVRGVCRKPTPTCFETPLIIGSSDQISGLCGQGSARRILQRWPTRMALALCLKRFDDPNPPLSKDQIRLNSGFFGAFLGLALACACRAEGNTRGSKYPDVMVLGPRRRYRYSIWDLLPLYLGT